MGDRRNWSRDELDLAGAGDWPTPEQDPSFFRGAAPHYSYHHQPTASTSALPPQRHLAPMLAPRPVHSPTESIPSSYKSDARDSNGSAPSERAKLDEDDDGDEQEVEDDGKDSKIKRARVCKACVGCES